MKKHSDEELIEGYLNWYRTSKEEYFWAWEEADERRAPDDLDFVFKLIQACQDDAEISYVAAGPLEDLFSAQHLVIKDKLSVMVRQHKNMRKAIQAFFCSPGSPERKTLDEILKKYGLHHASL
jgi:hypothetical protein